jgi:hypothetical protein
VTPRSLSRVAASLGAIVLAAGTTPSAAQQDEASCILESLPSSVRQNLTETIAEADQAKSGAVIQESRPAIATALSGCLQKYDWPQEKRPIVTKAFEYGLRLEASLIRLQANGLRVEDVSAMFESLPASMHDAIFGQRPMTREEMEILETAFERVVEQLAGPDGNALSEYITARAAYGFYSRQLVSD